MVLAVSDSYNRFDDAESVFPDFTGEPRKSIFENASGIFPSYDKVAPKSGLQRLLSSFLGTPARREERRARPAQAMGPIDPETGERFQFWPERLVRSASTLAGDVARGEVGGGLGSFGLRREDYTDIPAGGGPREGGIPLLRDIVNPPLEASRGSPAELLMERAQDLAGVLGGGGFASTAIRGAEKNALGIVPVAAAKGMKPKYNVNAQNDPYGLREAVSNTPGAKITDEGVELPLVRFQKSAQANQPSTRGAVQYSTPGFHMNYNKTAGTIMEGYGGAQKIEGSSLFKNPLVIETHFMGGDSISKAAKSLVGENEMKLVFEQARGVSNKAHNLFKKNNKSVTREDAVQSINQFLEEHAPELAGQGEYLLDVNTNSKIGRSNNRLGTALAQAAALSRVRGHGYDSILGHSKVNDKGTSSAEASRRFTEITDLRENQYPGPKGEYGVWPQYKNMLLEDSGEAGKPIAALEQQNKLLTAPKGSVTLASGAKRPPNIGATGMTRRGLFDAFRNKEAPVAERTPLDIPVEPTATPNLPAVQDPLARLIGGTEAPRSNLLDQLTTPPTAEVPSANMLSKVAQVPVDRRELLRGAGAVAANASRVGKVAKALMKPAEATAAPTAALPKFEEIWKRESDGPDDSIGGRYTKDDIKEIVESALPDEMEESVSSFIDERGREPTPKQLAKLEKKNRKFIEENWGDFVDSDFEGSGPRYYDYQIPGGENYRELLIKHPKQTATKEQIQPVLDKMNKLNFKTHPFKYETFANKIRKEGMGFNPNGWGLTPEEGQLMNRYIDGIGNQHNTFHSSTWDEPDILGHLRMHDRDIPGVGRSTHLEELNSEWHQEGKQKGYRDQGVDTSKWKVAPSSLGQKGASMQSGETRYDVTMPNGSIIVAGGKTPKEAIERASRSYNEHRAPDAPLKDTWPDYLLRRAIKEAVDNNHDAVSWTPGEHQLERHGHGLATEHSFDMHGWTVEPNNDGSMWTVASPDEKTVRYVPTANTTKFEALQKIHQKMLKNQKEAMGIRDFYDKHLVDRANEIGKQYGTKVEHAPTQVGKDTYEIKQVGNEHQVWLKEPGKKAVNVGGRSTEDAARQYINQFRNTKSRNADTQLPDALPTLRITPQLRKAVKDGSFSLLSDSGKPGAALAALEKAYGSVDQLRHRLGIKASTREGKTVESNRLTEQALKAIDEALKIGTSGVPRVSLPGVKRQVTTEEALKAIDEALKLGKDLYTDSGKPGAALAALENAPHFFSAVERALTNAIEPKIEGGRIVRDNKGNPVQVPMAAGKRMSPADWLGYLRNQPGVRQEELKHLGIEGLKSKSLTKAEMLKHVNENGPKLEETWKHGDSEPDTERAGERAHEIMERDHPDLTPEHAEYYGHYDDAMNEAVDELGHNESGSKYSEHQLPGGNNYRELLMRAPHKKLNTDKGILDKYSRDKFGYGYDRLAKWQQEELQAKFDGPQYRSSHWDEPNVLGHVRMNDRNVPGVGKALHLEELQSDWHQTGRKQGYVNNVPDAPFKQTWPDLLLKRSLREAADNGYDAVSWTPGEKQAERFDLIKHVDNLRWYRDGDTYRISAHKDNHISLQKNSMTPKDLANTFGKDIADKIINNKEQNGQMSGLDLKVGDAPMKAFYDKMLVDKANALGKKYGAKVEWKEINNSQVLPNSAGHLTPNQVKEIDAAFKEWSGGFNKDEVPEPEFQEWYRQEWAGNEFLPSGKRVTDSKDSPIKVPVLKLTPEFRKAIQQGFALFSDSGKPGAALAALEHTPKAAWEHGLSKEPSADQIFATAASVPHTRDNMSVVNELSDIGQAVRNGVPLNEALMDRSSRVIGALRAGERDLVAEQQYGRRYSELDDQRRRGIRDDINRRLDRHARESEPLKVESGPLGGLPGARSAFQEHIGNYIPEQEFQRDFFAGMHSPKTKMSYVGNKKLGFEGPLKLNDQDVGYMKRTIDFKNGIAHHDALSLEHDMRGSGIAKNLLANQIAAYQRLGLNAVETFADIDIGSYAWSKYGFLPADGPTWQGVARRSQKRLDDLYLKRRIDKEDFDVLSKVLESKDPRAIWDVADYQGRTHAGEPIAKELLIDNSYDARLDLYDPEVMTRFHRYVRKGK